MFVPSCWEKHFLAGPSLDIFFLPQASIKKDVCVRNHMLDSDKIIQSHNQRCCVAWIKSFFVSGRLTVWAEIQNV